MKAKDIGIFSAIFASICCIGPLLLILLGLGTLGMGAIIGKYHWWFLGIGVLLISIAWRYFFKEKKAKVKYNPTKTNINQLIEAINKTGYKITPPG